MSYKSSAIAAYLGASLHGPDIDVNGFSSLSGIVAATVVFAKKFKPEFLDILNRVTDRLAIVTEQYDGKIEGSYIVSVNPRLDYIKTISKFFVKKDIDTGIDVTAVIRRGAVIGEGVTIGAHCYISEQCTIGSGTVIMPNVTILGKVDIGTNCTIKAGTTIGGAGFGFEYDNEDVPVHFPHTGSVRIGNNVHIGSNTCIDRATIDCTVIADNVKIDNLCQIAHNVHIGENTLITGGSMIGGGVTIGRHCWLGPNSTIYQQMKIEDNSLVGIGSVVIKKVKEGTTVFGNPAKRM